MDPRPPTVKSATRGGHHRRTLSRSCVPQIPNGHQISEGRRLHSVLGVTAWPTLKKGIVFFSTGRNRALKLGPLRLSLLLPVSGQSRHLSRPVASHRPIFTISSAKAPHTGATDTGAVIILETGVARHQSDARSWRTRILSNLNVSLSRYASILRKPSSLKLLRILTPLNSGF